MTHLHHLDLRILIEMVIRVENLSTMNSYVCKGCALGKYGKTAFPRSDNRVVGMLDLVHNKLCGQMSTTSLKVLALEFNQRL